MKPVYKLRGKYLWALWGKKAVSGRSYRSVQAHGAEFGFVCEPRPVSAAAAAPEGSGCPQRCHCHCGASLLPETEMSDWPWPLGCWPPVCSACSCSIWDTRTINKHTYKNGKSKLSSDKFSELILILILIHFNKFKY